MQLAAKESRRRKKENLSVLEDRLVVTREKGTRQGGWER